MRAASKRRGIEITSLSRPIRLPDFRDFDLILAMDNQNRGGILMLNPRIITCILHGILESFDHPFVCFHTRIFIRVYNFICMCYTGLTCGVDVGYS